MKRLAVACLGLGGRLSLLVGSGGLERVETRVKNQGCQLTHCAERRMCKETAAAEIGNIWSSREHLCETFRKASRGWAGMAVLMKSVFPARLFSSLIQGISFSSSVDALRPGTGVPSSLM